MPEENPQEEIFEGVQLGDAYLSYLRMDDGQRSNLMVQDVTVHFSSLQTPQELYTQLRELRGRLLTLQLNFNKLFLEEKHKLEYLTSADAEEESSERFLAARKWLVFELMNLWTIFKTRKSLIQSEICTLKDINTACWLVDTIGTEILQLYEEVYAHHDGDTYLPAIRSEIDRASEYFSSIQKILMNFRLVKKAYIRILFPKHLYDKMLPELQQADR